jgi:hypothetical protein
LFEKGEVLPPLLITLSLYSYYAIGAVQVEKDCLKLNVRDQLLVNADNINIH